jgi:BirA family biotin operon repressor/biotin-[acetyl-CoA-carboxylase] ligase
MAQLQAAGYVIEHHPHRGYRLLASPDRLVADDMLSRLPECRWIREVLVFQKTASTNDLVAGLGRDGAAPGVAVFAEEQTAGRGRLGRRWQSDPALGLWFSILLRPEMPLGQWPRLTLWIAFAVARGIGEYAGRFLPGQPSPLIAVKWPNDLYISGRKVAGILVESSLGENPFAVAGIGLNVNHSSFPPPLDATAISLRSLLELTLELEPPPKLKPKPELEPPPELDRNALAAAILLSLDQSYSLISSDFPQILAWASSADYLRGRSISATVGDTIIEGIAEGLTPEAALLIRTNDGSLIPLTSGEVTRFSSAP